MRPRRQAQLKDVIDVLVSMARNIQLKRAVTAADPDPTLNFWRVQYGNLLDVAVLDWCKLFGAEVDPISRTTGPGSLGGGAAAPVFRLRYAINLSG